MFENLFLFNKTKWTFSSSINVIKIDLKLKFGFKTNLKDNNLYQTFEFNLINYNKLGYFKTSQIK